MVHIMEQYFPRAHVGKRRRGAENADAAVIEPGGVSAREDDVKSQVRYADINRPVDLKEVASVTQAARDAGIWRFIEAARHGGFNM